MRKVICKSEREINAKKQVDRDGGNQCEIIDSYQYIFVRLVVLQQYCLD